MCDTEACVRWDSVEAWVLYAAYKRATASLLFFAAILQSLTASKKLNAVSTLAFHLSTSSGILGSLKRDTSGTIQAWKQNQTAFQPEMRSGMQSRLMSSIVLQAISRHFPTDTFSSVLRLAHEACRSAVARSMGRWSMMRMFWNRHFITNRVRRRKSGHGSSVLDRIEGKSSCHFTSCVS